MQRFTRAQMKDIDDQTGVCAGAAQDLQEAIDAFNAAIEAAKTPVTEAIERYNEAIQGLRELYEPISTDAQDYMSERTERWQEGDKGQQYQRWIDALNDPDVREISLDFPDDLEIPDEVPDWSDSSFLPATALEDVG